MMKLVKKKSNRLTDEDLLSETAVQSICMAVLIIKFFIMKVKILQRNVYYKVATIEIEIPDDWNNKDGIENYYDEYINDYLHDNEDLWVDKIDHKMNESEFIFGFGMDSGDWTDKDQDSEWRYECDELKIGGHL